MSRKSWLKMVPTENCDILMTFPGTLGSGLSSLLVLWWTPSLVSLVVSQPLRTWCTLTGQLNFIHLRYLQLETASFCSVFMETAVVGCTNFAFDSHLVMHSICKHTIMSFIISWWLLFLFGDTDTLYLSVAYAQSKQDSFGPRNITVAYSQSATVDNRPPLLRYYFCPKPSTAPFRSMIALWFMCRCQHHSEEIHTNVSSQLI